MDAKVKTQTTKSTARASINGTDRRRQKNALGANLQHWRKHRRLTVKALATISNVPGGLIRAIESGHQFEKVGLGTVQALARALDLQVAVLLACELPPSPRAANKSR